MATDWLQEKLRMFVAGMASTEDPIHERFALCAEDIRGLRVDPDPGDEDLVERFEELARRIPADGEVGAAPARDLTQLTQDLFELFTDADRRLEGRRSRSAD